VNLVADPKHAAELARLKQLLLAHMERTGDPQLENFRTTLTAK
jgi:N-sulfoglucosamine sulfohydrolase